MFERPSNVRAGRSYRRANQQCRGINMAVALMHGQWIKVVTAWSLRRYHCMFPGVMDQAFVVCQFISH